MNLTTFPTMDVLEKLARATPEYMRPNTIPFAAIAEGYLSKDRCESIVNRLMKISPYEYKTCGAVTRECGHVLELESIKYLAQMANDWYWNYDIDPVPMTWLQTYSTGGSYRLHMDDAPGRMRKLTAVAMLTDPEEYEGGQLTIHYEPEKIDIPKTQGTVVVFQSRLLHEVAEVTSGNRQTTNMSFCGPPWR